MIHQLAMSTPDIDREVENLMLAGYGEWHRDQIELSIVRIGFNAGLGLIRTASTTELMPDIEFMFVQDEGDYKYGPPAHKFGVKHYGIRVGDEEEHKSAIERFDLYDLFQEVYTLSHTSKTPEDVSFRHTIWKSNRVAHPVVLIERSTREAAEAHAVDERNK